LNNYGLKINFHKSELFCFGKATEMEHPYKDIFGCTSGALPFRYLGITIHYRMFHNSDGIQWKLDLRQS
jgi:hypothetical protein